MIYIYIINMIDLYGIDRYWYQQTINGHWPDFKESQFAHVCLSSSILLYRRIRWNALPSASFAGEASEEKIPKCGRKGILWVSSNNYQPFLLSIQIDFVKTDGWFRKFISLTAMVIDFTARVGTLTKTSLSIWIHGARWQPVFVSTEMNQDKTVQEAYFTPKDYTHTI